LRSPRISLVQPVASGGAPASVNLWGKELDALDEGKRLALRAVAQVGAAGQQPDGARAVIARVGLIDGGTRGDAIVAASPRTRSPSDGWFGVANQQSHAGGEARREC
jgi:hypothetical protein